jgi:hypothetical protein
MHGMINYGMQRLKLGARNGGEQSTLRSDTSHWVLRDGPFSACMLPDRPQLSVFFVCEGASGLWLQFERTYAAHSLLCRLQRRVRRWLRRLRALRLGFRVLVVDASRRTTGSAQRAVFSTPELRALVVRFLKGP